jgi:hypothetical protein
MNSSRNLGRTQRFSCPVDLPRLIGLAWLTLAPVAGLGCSEPAPPATVEGILRLNGKPLDNCLVTFFPESSRDAKLAYSAGLTDQQGIFRLRTSTQQEGAALGRHRVTILDLSVSTGVYRSDNGTLDAEPTKSKPPPSVRRSRVPGKFLSLTETPLSKEVQPGHQFIDLDIR